MFLFGIAREYPSVVLKNDPTAFCSNLESIFIWRILNHFYGIHWFWLILKFFNSGNIIVMLYKILLIKNKKGIL